MPTADGENGLYRAPTGTAITAYSEMSKSFAGYDPDVFESGRPEAPDGLDKSSTYIYGVDNSLLAEFFAAQGQIIPADFTLPTSEVVVTLYPASKLPSANIDYDLFNLIIDPVNYKQSDLEYFAERGVTPATKNADGSYTIKSQLILPFGGK